MTWKVRSSGFTALTAFTAAIATLLVSALPFVRLAYENPQLHTTIQTAEGLVALLAAFLVYGRVKEKGRLTDVALTFALTVLGLTNLMASIVPTLVPVPGGEAPAAWGPLGLRMIGALAIAAAASPSTRRLRRPSAAGRSLVLTSFALVGVMGALEIAVVDYLPSAVTGGGTPPDASSPVFTGHPLVFGAQVAGILLYSAAAIGFTIRADRENDLLMRWLGAGAAISAFARVNYALYPSLYSDYVYTGDLLRMGFYLFILVGAYGEIRASWEARAQATATEDRRRLATYLHDGLAQELVLISGLTRRLARGKGDSAEHLRRLEGVAERAVGEARRAMANLTRPDQQGLDDALTDLAEEYERRYPTRITLDLSPVSTDPVATEEFLRIAREALRNAISHGSPKSITIRLSDRDGVELQVVDDGTGFDPTSESRGFGLVTMKERAAALGARFDIRSDERNGTTVEVKLPSKR